MSRAKLGRGRSCRLRDELSTRGTKSRPRLLRTQNGDAWSAKDSEPIDPVLRWTLERDPGRSVERQHFTFPLSRPAVSQGAGVRGVSFTSLSSTYSNYALAALQSGSGGTRRAVLQLRTSG